MEEITLFTRYLRHKRKQNGAIELNKGGEEEDEDGEGGGGEVQIRIDHNLTPVEYHVKSIHRC